MTTKSRQPFATPLHAVPSASVDQPWRTFLSAYCDRGWTNTHREIHTISYNHTQLQHLRFVEMIPQKMYETFPSDVLWSGNKTLLSICCDYVQPYIPILHSIFYVTACNRTQVTCSRLRCSRGFWCRCFEMTNEWKWTYCVPTHADPGLTKSHQHVTMSALHDDVASKPDPSVAGRLCLVYCESIQLQRVDKIHTPHNCTQLLWTQQA